jgi:AGZA family xanthine/uracil permease-like MFS transporter
MMAKEAVRASGGSFAAPLVAKFQAGGTAIGGAFALEQGFIFTAMILSAMTVALIERRFVRAAAWSAAAAVLSLAGLMHSYVLTGSDSTGAFGRPAWSWAAAYGLMTLLFLAARWLVVADEEPPAP